jgi:hypothetical protein
MAAMSEEFNDWRGKAVSLLESSPRWTQERNLASATLTQRISTLLAPLTHPSSRSNAELQALLRQVVETAARLAVDLAKQRARYEVQDRFEGPVATFDPAIMQDVLQASRTEVAADGKLVNELKGREVRLVVFPLVVRWATGKSVVISKAKVLV